MFIPTRINVGFRQRSDTYTGNLAYIIYYDNKGVLRKEKSWNSWRDHKIDAQEFENKPTSGFVLNKGVGGVRQSYGWNARNEYIRVFDPRGFEFEISVANLLFILQECNCDKGKGLEGEFVYAWSGNTLALLPVGCPEYKKCTSFTALQDGSVSAKDMVPGTVYVTKKQQQLLYLGKLHQHNQLNNCSYYDGTSNTTWSPVFKTPVKLHVFYDIEMKGFVFEKGLKKLSEQVSPEQHAEFHTRLAEYTNSIHGTAVVDICTREVENDDPILVTHGNSQYESKVHAEVAYNSADNVYLVQYTTYSRALDGNEKSYYNRGFSTGHVKYKMVDGVCHKTEDSYGKNYHQHTFTPESKPKLLIFQQASGSCFFFPTPWHHPKSI